MSSCARRVGVETTLIYGGLGNHLLELRLAECGIPHELESCACYKNLNNLNQMFLKTFSFGHVSPYVLIFVKKKVNS